MQEWVINHWSAPELIAILMELYRYALKLTARTAIILEESDRKLEKVGFGEEKPFTSRVKFDPNYPFLYFRQLDPFQDDKENNERAMAVSTWRKDFEIHCGRDAVSVIRVLHEYVTRRPDM